MLNTMSMQQKPRNAPYITKRSNKGKTSSKNIHGSIKLILLISVVSILPNILFFKFNYGSFIPLPSVIYNHDFGLESNSIIEILGIIFKRLPYILNIVFGSEMGLLYTNPVIPLGFISSIITIIIIFRDKEADLYHTILLISLLFIFYGFGFSIHLWWLQIGSNYGYRYLLQILPGAIFGVFIVYNYLSNNRIRYLKYYKRIIIILCTISIISVVLFSVTEKLKLSEKVNTFNKEALYSANGYMRNLPVEMVKPYTWARFVGKSSFGYLISPIIVKLDILGFVSNTLLLKSIKNNKHVKNDIKKYIDRSKLVNFNNISQLFVLLIVWLFIGNKFYWYNSLIIYESKNK